MIRAVRLAAMVYLKKRVEQVPAVTVVPAASLEGSWPPKHPARVRKEVGSWGLIPEDLSWRRTGKVWR